MQQQQSNSRGRLWRRRSQTIYKNGTSEDSSTDAGLDEAGGRSDDGDSITSVSVDPKAESGRNSTIMQCSAFTMVSAGRGKSDDEDSHGELDGGLPTSW